jgi:ferritin-like metal-binding protein YciE
MSFESPSARGVLLRSNRTAISQTSSANCRIKSGVFFVRLCVLEEREFKLSFGILHAKGFQQRNPIMSKITNLHDVYVEQLKDLHSAETQLIKALPKMAKAATSPELAEGFKTHLEQTKEHAARLEKIFQGLDEKPTGKKCKAMAGLIEEGGETIEEDASPVAKDALLIAAAQRVEHYEIAGYGSVKTYANLLGEDEAVKLLEQTLQEEKDTDQKLTEAAESINVQAEEGEVETTTSSRHR